MNGRMGGDFSNSGDLNRSVELLWRRQEPGRRGPKQRLSTEEVVQTAIRLADADGLEALSMRKVAQEMGVTPMSLYTYVPSKAELADLMFDRVLAANSIGSVAMLLLAVLGFLTGRPEFLDLAITYGLLNIVGTIAILKFFRQGDLGDPGETRP